MITASAMFGTVVAMVVWAWPYIKVTQAALRDIDAGRLSPDSETARALREAGMGDPDA